MTPEQVLTLEQLLTLDVVTSLLVAGFILILPSYLLCLTLQLARVTVLWIRLRAIERPVRLPYARQRVEMEAA